MIDANNVTYFGSGDGYLYSSYGNRRWDNDRWKFQCNGELHSSPAIGGDGTIYIGCDDGYLYAIGEKDNPELVDVFMTSNQKRYKEGNNLKIEAKIIKKEGSGNIFLR